MLRGVVLHGCREEVEFDVRIQEEGPSEGVTELGKEPVGLWDSEADVRPWGREVYMQASSSLLVTREGKRQLRADTERLVLCGRWVHRCSARPWFRQWQVFPVSLAPFSSPGVCG